MKVDTSKIKKFGQISSIFEVGTIENEAIQRDKRPAPAIVFASATAPSRFAHFWQGANPLRLQNHILISESGPGSSGLTLLTCECASRQNGVYFLHIWNFKSGF